MLFNTVFISLTLASAGLAAPLNVAQRDILARSDFDTGSPDFVLGARDPSFWSWVKHKAVPAIEKVAKKVAPIAEAAAPIVISALKRSDIEDALDAAFAQAVSGQPIAAREPNQVDDVLDAALAQALGGAVAKRSQIEDALDAALAQALASRSLDARDPSWFSDAVNWVKKKVVPIVQKAAPIVEKAWPIVSKWFKKRSDFDDMQLLHLMQRDIHAQDPAAGAAFAELIPAFELALPHAREVFSKRAPTEDELVGAFHLVTRELMERDPSWFSDAVNWVKKKVVPVVQKAAPYVEQAWPIISKWLKRRDEFSDAELFQLFHRDLTDRAPELAKTLAPYLPAFKRVIPHARAVADANNF